MRRKTLFWRLLPISVAPPAVAALLAVWVHGAVAEFPLWPIATAALALAGAGTCLLVVRRIRPTLLELHQAVDRLASGEPCQKLAVPDERELAALVEAFQAMAERLHARIASILRQQQQQEAVLASMAEGVLAVDEQERVISANRAAARLLDADYERMPGRSLHELVRNVELRRLVTGALAGERPLEGDLVLRHARERALQARGTALRDQDGAPIGAVIVLNDVSRLRQLETMRRDFAANVSHELKTPIASIKGFVETLLDGALDNRVDAERFLRIVARQADRLDAIIEDLLSLATIEKEAEAGEIVVVTAPLAEPLEHAVYDCAAKAAERGVLVEWTCPPDLLANINAPLLQQAVANLLDNAIKYSEPGRTVRLSARVEGRWAAVDVADEGCGIAAAHLPRLFERFYRVDRARSRKQGGTGLGLAIVKHIALAHRGDVSVESKPGAGSVFTIRLPLP